MGFFSCCIPNICIFNKKTYEEEEMKKMEKIKEIRVKRISLLPFAYKYNKIACDVNDTNTTLNANKSKTEELSKKSQKIYESAKRYKELAKEASKI